MKVSECTPDQLRAPLAETGLELAPLVLVRVASSTTFCSRTAPRERSIIERDFLNAETHFCDREIMRYHFGRFESKAEDGFG